MRHGLLPVATVTGVDAAGRGSPPDVLGRAAKERHCVIGRCAHTVLLPGGSGGGRQAVPLLARLGAVAAAWAGGARIPCHRVTCRSCDRSAGDIRACPRPAVPHMGPCG